MRALLAILVSFILFALLTQTSHAQIKPFDSAQGKQGITVTPSIVRLDLSQDPPEAEIFYKNSTHSQIELSFFAQDFSELEEEGRVKFLQEKDVKNYQYGLTSWITFEKQSMTLSPGEQQKIKLFINKDKLTPGGHYASIQAAMKQSVTGKGQVPVKAILSTLLFVRTATGNEQEELNLQSASPIRTFLDFPDTFLLRLQNTGNVELVPYGTIEIIDMFGNTVTKGIINEGSLITLPESVRRFDVPLIREAHFIAPGIYKAEINTHFGSSRGETGKKVKKLRGQVTFVSWGDISPLACILLLGATVLFWKRQKFIQSKPD